MVVHRTGGTALGDHVAQIVIGQLGVLGMDRLGILGLLLFLIFGTPVEKGQRDRPHHNQGNETKDDFFVDAHNVLMTFLWTFSQFSRSR